MATLWWLRGLSRLKRGMHGGPEKENRNAILPQLVSVYEVTSPEKNDTEIISKLVQ